MFVGRVQGQVQVKIGVWDKDDNADDFVGFLKQDITTRPSRSRAMARTQRFSLRNRIT